MRRRLDEQKNKREEIERKLKEDKVCGRLLIPYALSLSLSLSLLFRARPANSFKLIASAGVQAGGRATAPGGAAGASRRVPEEDRGEGRVQA
jgi:hypothetical protein